MKLSKRVASSRRATGVMALVVTFGGVLAQLDDVFAACTNNYSALPIVTTTCSTAAPNPFVTVIGLGQNAHDRHINMLPGASIDVPKTSAITLDSRAIIHVMNGGAIRNHVEIGDGPPRYADGDLSTIQIRNDGAILVDEGGVIAKTGTHPSSAIYLLGAGNIVENHGLISGENHSVLAFEFFDPGDRNIIDNYGTIARTGGGALFGSGEQGPPQGVIVINRTGGQMNGDLNFLDGDDDLQIFPGSTISGSIDGGGGHNRLLLDGETGTSGQLAALFPRFQEVIKQGDGQWTYSGSLAGAETTTVSGGRLILTGDNTNYAGATIIDPGASLQARVQSLPSRLNPADNTDNIENNGLLAIIQPAGDNASYIGQITGTGAIEKTGGGEVTLAPAAAGGNTFAGGLRIREGVIAAATDGALGAATSAITIDGGALRFTGNFTLSPGRAVSITANNGVVDVIAGVTGVIAPGVSGPGAMTKTGDGVLTLAGANNWSGGTTIAAGILRLGDGGTSGTLVGDVLNQAQLEFNRSDVASFGGVISGPGGVAQAGSGTTVLTAVNNWTGATHVRSGALAVGDAAHPGAAITGGGAIDVAPGAMLGGYGSVAGNVTNAGVIAVANALTAFSNARAGGFTIGGQLINSGLLQLGAGQSIGNTLTVAGYQGVGGAMALNSKLGSDGSPSDRLIIDGGTATGATQLRVTNVGGFGALTSGNGILVVSAINGGSTGATAFAMANPVKAGPYLYSLVRGSTDSSSPPSWYLRSAKDDNGGGGSGGGGGTGGDGGGTGGGGNTGSGSGGGTNTGSGGQGSSGNGSSGSDSSGGSSVPAYRPETALYAALPAMALLYGHRMIGSQHDRVGEQSLAPALGGAMWGRVIGTQGLYHNNGGDPGGPKFRWGFYAMQSGMDVYRSTQADGSRDILGIHVGVGRADGNVTHRDGARGGDKRFEAYSAGAYWTHYGATGWYIDAVAQGIWHNAQADSGENAALTTSGAGIALSLEAGYPFQLGDGWALEPQAQIVLQTINLTSAHDGAALVKFANAQSVAPRLGARLLRTWLVVTEHGPLQLNAWLRGNVWNEFAGTPRASFSSEHGYVPFRADMKGAWVDVSAGITAQLNSGIALYSSANYQKSFDGDRHSWSGKAGLRISW